MAAPFYPAIVPNGAYSLAAAFITSCPSTNAPLPFSAYPGLTVNTADFEEKVGEVLSFTTKTAPPAGSFVTFVSGLSVTSVALSGSGTTFSAAVPATASGQTYVFVTNANVTAITDAVVLFGPAITDVTPAAPTLDYSVS
jgi:hypothetical protein